MTQKTSQSKNSVETRYIKMFQWWGTSGQRLQWHVSGILLFLFWWAFLSVLWMRPWMKNWYIFSKNKVDKGPNNLVYQLSTSSTVPHFSSYYWFLSPYIYSSFSFPNIPNIILHPWLFFLNNIHVSDLWKLTTTPAIPPELSLLMSLWCCPSCQKPMDLSQTSSYQSLWYLPPLINPSFSHSHFLFGLLPPIHLKHWNSL